ncbi:GntR family transcriptional regulator [Enterococcus hirae]|nr:GntR family transcriptional regulator [Enterococcus hirae]
MFIEIDPTGQEPIYMQMRRQIILGIAKGELQNGEQLPSIRQLADELDVNTMTISKAYNLLKEEGYLITDRRRGTVITLPEKITPTFAKHFERELTLLLSEALANGFSKEMIASKTAQLLEPLAERTDLSWE